MTATVAAPAAELPGVATLSPAQLEGLACARCSKRLPPTVGRVQALGEITQPSTVRARPACRYTLYACTGCAPPPPQPRASIADLPSWTPPDTGPATPVGNNSETTLRRVLARLRALPDTPPL